MGRRVRVFVDRYPLIGPVFWMLSLQYFITQLVVAAAWVVPFSLRFNTISDLGNTVCAQYGARFVCSPEHVWMNTSFVLLGLTMIAGAGLIYHEFERSRASAAGFGGMAIAGLGTVLVGLFPENTTTSLHALGAFMPFVIGNLAIITLGVKLKVGNWLKTYSILSGVVALAALPLFLGGHTYGLGNGGWERVVAYPQTFWLITFGFYMSRNRP